LAPLSLPYIRIKNAAESRMPTGIAAAVRPAGQADDRVGEA
jgi:hypothetical protein